jgi:hypothetical protein
VLPTSGRRATGLSPHAPAETLTGGREGQAGVGVFFAPWVDRVTVELSHSDLRGMTRAAPLGAAAEAAELVVTTLVDVMSGLRAKKEKLGARIPPSLVAATGVALSTRLRPVAARPR